MTGPLETIRQRPLEGFRQSPGIGALLLKFRGQVARKVDKRAKNLLVILATFQHEGWPDAIDDPLPPKRGVDRVDRLQEAVRTLRKGLSFLEFQTEQGERVLWRVKA